MTTLLLTLLIAFIIVVLAIGSLAIGWLITGKMRMRPGACGRDPTKDRDQSEGCGSGPCNICKKEDPNKDK
jgi:hypothetical protein